MRSVLAILWLILISTAAVLAEEIEHPKKAICSVCFVMSAHEENKPEKVKGISEYEGTFHYFCSKGCKSSFDEDPIGFILPTYPQPLPELNLIRLDGQIVSLDSFTNRATLINFWATWCVICKKEIPHLQKLYEDLSSQGLMLIGVSTDELEKAAEKVGKYVKKEKLTFPNFIDSTDDPAWAKLHIKAVPALYLVDRKGQIVERWIGKTKPGEVRAAVLVLLSQ